MELYVSLFLFLLFLRLNDTNAKILHSDLLFNFYSELRFHPVCIIPLKRKRCFTEEKAMLYRGENIALSSVKERAPTALYTTLAKRSRCSSTYSATCAVNISSFSRNSSSRSSNASYCSYMAMNSSSVRSRSKSARLAS